MYCRHIKRWFDVIVVLLTAPITVPVSLVGWFVVRLTSKGPGFFGQTRIGRDCQSFTLWKLRSMHDHVEGPSVTVGEDPRITRVGRVLRRWKLDEVPQFWNVLRGDMSLVGPRPEVPEWFVRHPEEFTRILRLRPGITDLASIAYFDEAAELASRAASESGDYDDVLRTKLEMNEIYVEHASPGLDLLILALTGASFVSSTWAAASARVVCARLGASDGHGSSRPVSDATACG